MKNKSIIWWILIGWWAVPLYYLLVWWWWTPIKKMQDKKRLAEMSVPPFEIATWGPYIRNLNDWRHHNSRDQWKDAWFTTKKLYRYPWTTTTVTLIAEPDNEHDSMAIAVYLEGYHIGYVPREINEIYHDVLLSKPYALCEIHGGDSKYIDDTNDLVIVKADPIVEIKYVSNTIIKP